MEIKIHHKLTIISGILIAFISLCAFLYLADNLSKQAYFRLQETLQNQIQLARLYLEKNTPKEGDSFGWDRVADEVGQALHDRVTLIALDGTVLGDSDVPLSQLKGMENQRHRPEVERALSGNGEKIEHSSGLAQGKSVSMAVLFGNGKEKKGILRVTIALSKTEFVNGNLSQIVLFSFIFTIILAGLINYVAYVIFSQPLSKISAVAKQISEGDFSRKIYIYTKDAIGKLAGAINDMAEQMRLRIEEVALEKSRLEAVLLSMFEGVLVVDKNENILLMNKALKELLNIKEDPAGKKTLNVIRNMTVQEIIDKALTSRQEVYSAEIQLLYPSEKIILIHAAPVILQGYPEGVVLVFHDISELRRLERIRQEFVANVSHELRTPVANIKGYAETLLEGALDDKDNAHDFVKIINMNADRLARLIEDLLDLSRIESGKLTMNIQPCLVRPLIDRVLAGFNKAIAEKKLAITNDIPPEIPSVLADADRLAQVILNLVDNAIKYTPQGGKIFLSASERQDFVEIRIQDTGIGIPEEHLHRLFERFYRVDKARSREMGGTGLGLSIVKHIVQALNGEIFVTSEEGKGSTFSVRIPKVSLN